MIPVPKGFKFAVAQAGFKREGRFDLAAIVSDAPAVAAGVFTTNKFPAAPVTMCRELLAKAGTIRGALVNSGQANACTGDEGLVNCRVTMEMAGKALGLGPEDLLPASTGVIGAQLKMDRWKAAMPELAKSLGSATPMEAAKAIMTTDTFAKPAWAKIEHEGVTVRLFGMAKGAGMISPDMATLLGFIICDADVDPKWWAETLKWAVDESFNRITVDGDTSTNDTILALANGASGVRIDSENAREALAEALKKVCQDLAYMIVQDAEGGTKVLRIIVQGAVDNAQAELAARAVGNSPLVKTAMFGQDPNWGRIVAALGRSGAEFNPDHVILALGPVVIFKDGTPVPGDMDALLAPLMRKQDIEIEISLGEGPGSSVLLASDFGYDYVKINADYRT